MPSASPRSNGRKPPAGPSQRYRMILSAVHMVYRLVNSTYNVRELSLRLTRLLCQFISARSASIYILDPEKKKIVLVAIFDNKINILLEKKKDLEKITPEERRVTEGYAVFSAKLIGLPLVAAENIGAILIRRAPSEPAFTDFDREMLTVFVEQAVTALTNLQLYEQQQKTILSSIHFISQLMAKRGYRAGAHTPVYFSIIRCLAEKLNMSQESIERLYYASVLHDAGAMDVPYDILAKTSQLTPQEFKIIRDLPSRSAELIRPVEFLRPILPIVLYHHEKYDGTGYPSGLKKDQIPRGARVLAVVEAFEAMVRGRPYKKRLTTEEAFEELKRNSGSQFDPQVVGAFCELYRQKKFRNYLNQIRS